jgi:membrane protein DedA with SNARE-associated domain
MISLVQCAAFLLIGLVFGKAYMKIGEYLDYFAAGISIVAVLVIIGGLAYRFKK